MHPFCGTPVGREGFGQPIMCPSCEPKMATILSSASPIVQAFSRQPVVLREDKSTDALIDESEAVNSSSDSASSSRGDALSDPSRRRSTQSVSTLSQRRKAVKWMEMMNDKEGSKHLCAKAVAKFPRTFTSATANANLAKAMRWWKMRASITGASRGSVVLSSRRANGRKRVALKAGPGRGRRRSAFVKWIYPELLSEFDRLRKAGLKFDAPLLRQLAVRVLDVSPGPFGLASVDDNGALWADKITARWVQQFMECNGIVLRAQTGKRQISPEKQMQIEKEVAFHLGVLKRGFESGDLNEDTVENIDETHFVFDFDNGKTLGFSGEKQIKYADVVSGGEGMTMVVRISGGSGARILPPMMIFTNATRSYPIRGVPDNIDGVCYRSGPKGWMDKRVFREYLTERRAQRPDRLGRVKTIFLDNCSGHLSELECESELRALNARLRYLPANATDLCQPADSFVIAKIKNVWRRLWNEKKIELIEDDAWQNTPRKNGDWSGKLRNPGKHFFLSLAAKAVREVNGVRDTHGLTYARKAMIRCGLSLGTDGNWSTQQLFPHLQEIVKKYPSHFDGEAVTTAAVHKK